MDEWWSDFGVVDQWCMVWGMKLTSSKTKTKFVSRYKTATPCFPVLSLNDVVVDERPHLEILGVIFDAKLTFECNRRMVAKSAQ